MNNEVFSRGFRGEIRKIIKEKGQAIASSAVITGLGVAGVVDALNVEKLSDHEKSSERRLLGSSNYIHKGANSESPEIRIAREALQYAMKEEILMQESLEVEVEALPTPLIESPASVPAPVLPAPAPEPNIFPAAVPVEPIPVDKEVECPDLIENALGWPGCEISFCESGWDPNATGGAGERGWFQIHPLHSDSTYDPAGNVAAAVRISGGGASWEAWTVNSVLTNGGICPNGRVVPPQ